MDQAHENGDLSENMPTVRAGLPFVHPNPEQQSTLSEWQVLPLPEEEMRRHYLQYRRVLGRGAESVALQVEHGNPFDLVVKENHDAYQSESEHLHRYDRMRELRQYFRGYFGDEAKDIIVNQKPWHVRTELGRKMMPFQKFVPEMEIPHLQLRGGYGEFAMVRRASHGRRLDMDDYQQVNEAFVERKHEESIDAHRLWPYLNGSTLQTLMNQAEQAPGLHAHLCELVSAMIDYSNERGEVFDLFGSDNIILFEKGDTGEYTSRFIDPLLSNEDVLPMARQALERVMNGQAIDGNYAGCLLNVLNYTRIINGLASWLSLPQRFQFLPVEWKGKTIDYRRIYTLAEEYVSPRRNAA